MIKLKEIAGWHALHCLTRLRVPFGITHGFIEFYIIVELSPLHCYETIPDGTNISATLYSSLSETTTECAAEEHDVSVVQ